MSTLLNTTKNFYIYQKERFPIVVLGLIIAVSITGGVTCLQRSLLK